MEQYFDYKYTKKEMVEFIKENKGQLATVELDAQDYYTNINIELFPSGKVSTYCRVDTSNDPKTHMQAIRFAGVLDDYIDYSI